MFPVRLNLPMDRDLESGVNFFQWWGLGLCPSRRKHLLIFRPNSSVLELSYVCFVRNNIKRQKRKNVVLRLVHRQPVFVYWPFNIDSKLEIKMHNYTYSSVSIMDLTQTQPQTQNTESYFFLVFKVTACQDYEAVECS
jgi:hypothetical protein